MKATTLHELFLDELKDLYDAEHQITQALPKMEKAATSPELKAAFREHLQVTEQQIRRLEQVFESLGEKASRKTCPGVAGIIKEGEKLLTEAQGDALDAGLISAAQKVEHYEIAGYGCVRTWAQEMGHTQAVTLLQQTADEEGQADKKLTQLAESRINLKAEKKAA